MPPFADFDAGRYQLTVTIAGPSERWSYNLTKDFTVE